MVLLNDKLIRAILIARLKNQAIRPKAIIEELRVHNGNAIADVVALYKEAHCFEIKGDNDKIERIIKQGYYFNLSFRKITLVTTTKHLEKAIDILPGFWGIILIEKKNNKIILKHIRRTANNPDFDKSIALLTLWKSEILNLVDQKKNGTERKNKKLLATLIANSKKKEELSYDISSILINRYYHATVEI